MKEPVSAGLVAGAIAVNAGGGITIVAEGWPLRALSCGSGLEIRPGSTVTGDRDWPCGFDIPDAGDIERMTVSDCLVVDCWQDGFHLDGSWIGHRQRAVVIRFERCRARVFGMADNRIAIVSDRPKPAVKVHKPSGNAVNLAG